MRWASTLPSSTPHWSNELICQMVPWVKTLCSYRATELTENFGRESIGEDGVRRAVALEDPVGYQPIRRALGFNLLGRLPEGQRLGLGEDVRQEHVVMASELVERLAKRNEVTGDEPRCPDGSTE